MMRAWVSATPRSTRQHEHYYAKGNVLIARKADSAINIVIMERTPATTEIETSTFADILAAVFPWTELTAVWRCDPGSGSLPHGLFVAVEGHWTVRTVVDRATVALALESPALLLAPAGAWWRGLGGSTRSKVVLGFSKGHTYAHRSWHNDGETTANRIVSQLIPAHPGAPCDAVFSALLSLRAHDPASRMTALHLLKALVAECMAFEARSNEPQGSKGEGTWMRAQAFVQQHFADNICRESVAQALKIHPNHLSRLFRQHTGTTFQRYLAQLRLRHAAQLIQQGGLHINEIAAACGFGDVSHFTRAFRQRYGTPPSALRAKVPQTLGGGKEL